MQTKRNNIFEIVANKKCQLKTCGHMCPMEMKSVTLHVASSHTLTSLIETSVPVPLRGPLQICTGAQLAIFFSDSSRNNMTYSCLIFVAPRTVLICVGHAMEKYDSLGRCVNGGGCGHISSLLRLENCDCAGLHVTGKEICDTVSEIVVEEKRVRTKTFAVFN